MDTVIKVEKPAHRTPLVEALRKRHGCGVKVMRDRRTRRAKDARNHWSREDHG